MSGYRLTDIVRPGERVDLQTINYDDSVDEEKKYYISKVFDIIDDDYVEIFMPMDKSKMILIPVDTELEIYFYAQKGIFTCHVRVEERYHVENVAVVKLYVEDDITKHQRREYYRYSTVIGMTSRQMDEAEELEYMEAKQLLYAKTPEDKSVIVDISGGGIRFVSAAKYGLNRLVHCRFILPVRDENHMFDCVIRILGAKPVINNNKNSEFRGQFLFLDNFVRESIIRFIFDEERKMRQRK